MAKPDKNRTGKPRPEPPDVVAKQDKAAGERGWEITGDDFLRVIDRGAPPPESPGG